MNVRHVWTVACQGASIDNLTNSVSLFNALESITIPFKPSKAKPLLMSAEIVTLWSRINPEMPGSGLMRVFLTGPKERQPQPIELELNLQNMYHRTRINVSPAAFFASGLHLFCVQYKEFDAKDWITVAEIPLLIAVDLSIPKPIQAPG